MYIEDLVEVLQTNLTTTKKRYSHGRHRIQIALFHHLGWILWKPTPSSPQPLLPSYRYDPAPGP